MIEVCFCGWQGRVQDRRYRLLDDGNEGLACPNCGHIDTLEYLPERSRRDLLSVAQDRVTVWRYHTSPVRLRTAHPAA